MSHNPHRHKATPFNAFPFSTAKPPVPDTSWWTCSGEEFAQRQREAQQRMSSSSEAFYPKSDGSND